ncbi:MAG TPA: acyltransferase [Acidimicrobiales bacterium]|nr:acyltransferase [Acidimicrobiales bacterium]
MTPDRTSSDAGHDLAEASRTSHSPRYRRDIQGLRALAVILVVLVHASVPGFSGGFIGVDVFFVISGYVITELLLRQPHRTLAANLGHFYARRVRRIVPAATLVLVATVFGAYALLGTNFEPTLLGDVRWAALFGANFRLINTGSNYFIPGVAPSLVTHYWSLAVEEQFYIVYPLIVFTLVRAAPARFRARVVGGFLVLAIVASAWYSWHLSSTNAVEAYYSPLTRFWELALGGLASLVPVAWVRRTPRVNAALAFAALVVLLTAVYRLDVRSVFPGTLAWWPCAACAALLVTGVASAKGGPATWLSWRPLCYVGDISYSLYLWHYPWLMLPLQRIHPLGSDGARVVEVAGALVCAVLSYHLVENPIRYSRALANDGVATAMLLVTGVATSWVATLVVARLAHVG